MSFTDLKRREIKKYLLRKIDEDDPDLIMKVKDAFCISHTSVGRYITSELDNRAVIRSDKARCGYVLRNQNKAFNYDINDMDEYEDGIIYRDLIPLLPEEGPAKKIWRYVLPEIFNNAIEHSKGERVKVRTQINELYSKIAICDDGIGIFENIVEAMRSYGYENPRYDDAITELYKGKFTSCPERHTGEGIFFSMRLLDKLAIVSDGVIARYGYEDELSVIRSHLLAYALKLTKKGTVVVMQLENETLRDSRGVFNTYADIEDGFYKTRIPILEACLDRDPVARSQARRIYARLENFREIEFDFARVDMMGQGFADELFRVFQNKHPEVVLTPVNMNADVHRMYLYTINNKITAPRFDQTDQGTAT